ncbi:hypothetical protein NQF78_21045 [Pseudomonas monsensis]|uniref:Uncharacterized protein n=1 Tax=Pseudomonas monsensis TaxID=2745509 RepID=A0ABT3YZ55_9PSED|nr:hypothetical protein [Pseudomonas monsensis]MCY0110799.1 hypothetical protein [Pseudomonas monsensis]
MPDNGVQFNDWYAGFNTVGHVGVMNGVIDLPVTGDAFAMFG